MISLDLGFSGREDASILCLGAHSDDIEIGALGSILSLAQRIPQATITWVVFATGGKRAQEALASAEYCASGFTAHTIQLHEFEDGFFPSNMELLKREFEALKSQCHPDIVFTHCRTDAHQDHRVIGELTWQTFRDHMILEYEIPKFDGDLGNPNVFFPVTAELMQAKLDALERFFVSQQGRPWFTSDTFSALMRLRGVECNSASGFAEAFYGRKIVL